MGAGPIVVLPPTTPEHFCHTELMLPVLAGIATVVLLIVWAKFYPVPRTWLGPAVLAALV